MRTRLSGQAGMSLVEVTIILMVLATLTATIAPSMGDYLEDSRNVKAKEDVEAIGTGILRLLQDTGLGCLTDEPTNSTATPATAPCAIANRIDILKSGGEEGLAITATQYAAGGTVSSATMNWNSTTNADTIDDQLVQNDNADFYVSSALFTSGGGPRGGIGWRGAYLSGPIESDPWGGQYQANTMLLGVAADADNTVTEGGKGWTRDAIVISAGSNATWQTNFGLTNGTAVGDDVIYVIQGSSR
jgi:type II secretory pathway pseudopilin PulG